MVPSLPRGNSRMEQSWTSELVDYLFLVHDTHYYRQRRLIEETRLLLSLNHANAFSPNNPYFIHEMDREEISTTNEKRDLQPLAMKMYTDWCIMSVYALIIFLLYRLNHLYAAVMLFVAVTGVYFTSHVGITCIDRLLTR